jgi:filamentous hemagglutinin family protein
VIAQSKAKQSAYGLGMVFASVSVAIAFGFPAPTWGQVSADGSFNTRVNTSNNRDFTIEAGRAAGGNLYHSFQDFSVPTDGSASFNNASNVRNIIGRVTGGRVSTIDGLIRANGSANLFLINPSGLIFGANAVLDIGGSFVGSTGDRIQFADGTDLRTSTPQAPPLLSVSVPVGLQFGANPGSIQVLGSGNNITLDPETFSIVRSDRPPGLQVSSGQTLALIGGDVTLQGGNLTASSGRIEIGSVRNGEVGLVPLASGWRVDYGGRNSLGDRQLGTVQLIDAASVDVSGNTFGNISGNTSGNITGNTSGNTTGNASGNTTGNTSGNASGSVQGRGEIYESAIAQPFLPSPKVQATVNESFYEPATELL